MNDREYQITNLNRILEEGRLAPKFKRNLKFKERCDGCDGGPYIRYSDIMDYKLIIREGNEKTLYSSFANEETPIIAQYQSVEELVDDGWRLD